MHRSMRLRPLPVAVLLALVHGSASAVPITFDFTATVRDYLIHGPEGPTQGTITDPTLTGTFTVDLALAPPPVGSYLYGPDGPAAEFISADLSLPFGSGGAGSGPPGATVRGDFAALVEGAVAGDPDWPEFDHTIVLRDQSYWSFDFGAGLSGAIQRLDLLLVGHFLSDLGSAVAERTIPKFTTVAGRGRVTAGSFDGDLASELDAGGSGSEQLIFDSRIIGQSYLFDVTSVTRRPPPPVVVPEPGMLTLMLAGLVGLAFRMMRRNGRGLLRSAFARCS